MICLKTVTSWVLIRHVYVVQIETWFYHQDEMRIIEKSWRHGKRIQTMQINKTAI